MEVISLKKSMMVLAALMIAFMVSFPNGGTISRAQDNMDIDNMIKTAKTPEDHMKIAQYYDEQAAMMEKKAALHMSMGQAYKGTKMMGMTSHCQNLTKESEQAAKQYKAMAEAHRKMAHQMQSKSSQ
jgi:hypothetical protein